MKNLCPVLMSACLVLAIAPTAMAESSIEYHGGKKAYDRKIEAAAIMRAARKIGDLRGSLEGVEEGYIVKSDDLDKERTSSLGFPVIREERNSDTEATVPIV